jgi:hypothetical protein
MAFALSIRLERKNSKRIRPDVVKDQVTYLLSRATAGSRSKWATTKTSVSSPVEMGSHWGFVVNVTLERRSMNRTPSTTQLNQEVTSVLQWLTKACKGAKFHKYPWHVTDYKPIGWKSTNIPDLPAEEKEDLSHVVQGAADGEAVDDIVNFEKAKKIEEIIIPEELVRGSDSDIENHHAFKGLFGIGPHVRILFSRIKSMKDTQGRRRNHTVYWGRPACGKSSILLGAQKVLGPGAFVSINGNAATKAGIEAIFLDRLRKTGVPPILFVEEMEKTQETILTVWLSVMDERAEVRKVTFRSQQRVNANVLVVATVNDKVLFDRLMGGRPDAPGAISSRFCQHLYVPRPNADIMRRILLRDVELYGGDQKWVDPCLELAKTLNEDDPRVVLSYLDGQERLLNGSYQEDILSIRNLEKTDVEPKEGGVLSNGTN